jgi:hypothetical protein
VQSGDDKKYRVVLIFFAVFQQHNRFIGRSFFLAVIAD